MDTVQVPVQRVYKMCAQSAVTGKFYQHNVPGPGQCPPYLATLVLPPSFSWLNVEPSIINILAKLMCSVLGTSYSKPAPAPWASGDIYHRRTSLVHCRHLGDGSLRPRQLLLQTTLTWEKGWRCKLSEARLPSPPLAFPWCGSEIKQSLDKCSILRLL